MFIKKIMFFVLLLLLILTACEKDIFPDNNVLSHPSSPSVEEAKEQPIVNQSESMNKTSENNLTDLNQTNTSLENQTILNESFEEPINESFQNITNEIEETNLSEGLIGWWKLNEEGRIKDYAGKNNGFIVNNLSFINGSYFFDGNMSNKIQISYSEEIDVTGEEITLTAWINLNDCPEKKTYYQIIKHLRTNPSPGGYQLEINGNKDCSLRFGYRGGSDNFTSGKGTELIPGTWYFVAAVKNSTHIYTLINSELDLIDESIGTIKSNPQPLIIGSQVSEGVGGTAINGTIKNVRIYNKALSIDEIRQIYDSGQ